MQTTLSEQSRQLPRAAEAEKILRTCVHCGFCNATCPTYQLLGDELDGPRGRIYLIKQVLEGAPATAQTQLHLDRCLSCRNCETTCPSGVDYHNLLDIGRAVVDQAVPRPAAQRLLREGLRALAPNPGLFKGLLRMGTTFRPLLPRMLESKLPQHLSFSGLRPAPRHVRKVLLLEGCVQPGLSPNTNDATARVLDRLGISVTPVYAAKAREISERTLDLVQILYREPLEKVCAATERRIAVHCPCTLQHALKLGGAVEAMLTRLGFNLTAVPDGHLCCGSAGTYSLTQPVLARQLRDNRLNALESGRPELIVTSNVGCQSHLGSAGRTRVTHWIELVDQSLAE
jgi:Fe-S oxidoreductase